MKQFKSGKQRCSQMVDGITGDENLVKLWFSKFKDLLSSPSPDRAQQLADALNSLDLSSRDLDSLVISEDVVLNAVRKLKWGKSEAGLLSSDHLIFAPASFARVLAPVFTALLCHGHMPPVFRDAIIQPIPKGGNKVSSQSENYRGIALASCFSKLIEYCILEVFGNNLLSSQLQFGFKPGLSTTMCTGILKATVSRYLCGGSSVYGCLIDASKAFDTVDLTLLLEKLIERGLPIGVTRFILSWYQSQQVQVRWRAAVSEPFPVTRGVRQGGVLSPILFSLYIDDLLMEVAESGVGCHWDGLFVGALAYADDLTLLAPSPSALRILLGICERFGAANFLKFNPDKTQCIRFSRLHGNSSCHFVFCGKSIECCNSVTHLGHTLTANLMDGDDIFRCSRDFVRKANGILIKFGFCDPFILTKLLTCFCLSLYGCALWSLDSRAIKHLDVSINNCLRRIWSLPRNCHTSFLHAVSGCNSVFNTCYKRFCNLYRSAINSGNLLVRTVFQSACLSCHNFIGFIHQYGTNYIRVCTDVTSVSVNLVREIRDRSLFVSGFDPSEMNQIISALVT